MIASLFLCVALHGTHFQGRQRSACLLQAVKDLQMGTRTLYVICAEGKANKNITIANLVSPAASFLPNSHLFQSPSLAQSQLLVKL